jgi:hypothetical protein
MLRFFHIFLSSLGGLFFSSRFPLCKSKKSALSRKEETKMKRNLLITAAFALLGTMVASAQTLNVKAKIPFSFVVNHATLPAGEYSLNSVDDQGTALAIRNLDSKTTNLALSNACVSANGASKTKLVFHRYGDRYFLSQIWIAGNDRGREIPPGAREKEMARDYSMQQVILVAAR